MMIQRQNDCAPNEDTKVSLRESAACFHDTSIGKVGTSHSDIRCNIWERAKVRKNITHRLSSGSQRNIGYYALLWYEILHGEVGPFGTYTFSQILPDKIARFLFEFHGKEFRALGLPNLPDDRAHIDVHRMLDIYIRYKVVLRRICKNL